MSKKKPISVKARKAKGRRLQNWVAQKISDIVGLPWGKDTDIRPREMGQSGVDVSMSSAVLKDVPFSIECKNCEKWSVHKDIEQAKENIIEGTDWLLVYKRNNIEPVIIMDANKFFEIWDRYVYACNTMDKIYIEDPFYKEKE